MKIKTRELTGVALDWAVCKAKGDKLTALAIEYPEHAKHFPTISPSTDWNQGGPIIEREKISIKIKHDGYWMAFCQYNYMDEKRFFTLGDTPLIAAMRCFVASKLGDAVEVPDGLFTVPQPIEPVTALNYIELKNLAVEYGIMAGPVLQGSRYAQLNEDERFDAFAQAILTRYIKRQEASNGTA